MVSEIRVEGIEAACRGLDRVSRIVATRAVVNGLDAAAEVIEAALWPRVPVDLKAALNKAHGGHGALVSKLTRAIEVDAAGRGGRLEIGFGPLGHIALWVEYGHRMVRGGREFGAVAAHPFMRPAFTLCGQSAVEAFWGGVESTLHSASLAA